MMTPRTIWHTQLSYPVDLPLHPNPEVTLELEALSNRIDAVCLNDLWVIWNIHPSVYRYVGRPTQRKQGI